MVTPSQRRRLSRGSGSAANRAEKPETNLQQVLLIFKLKIYPTVLQLVLYVEQDHSPSSDWWLLGNRRFEERAVCLR